MKEPLEFEIDPELDPSLADLINRILPICNNYMIVSRFVEEHSAFEYGRSHHAISAAMREMLQEYHILIAQFEHQSHTNPEFTLQKLWYYITPSITAFESLASLIEEIEQKAQPKANSFDFFSENHEALPKIGGVLLSLLAERMVFYGGYYNFC